MPSIQDLIHRFEEKGGGGVRLALVVLLTFALLVCYNWRAYRNFGTLEAMDAAQVARNLAAGEGFTTDFVRPFSIHLVKKHNYARSGGSTTNALPDYARLRETAHPDLANPPAYPLLLAGVMKVLPFDFAVNQTKPFWSEPNPALRRAAPEDQQKMPARIFFRYQPDFLISLLNQFLLLALAVQTFCLARHLFDRNVAWMSYVLIVGCEYLWRFSTTGLSTLMLLHIFVGLVWLLVWMEREEREPVWSHRAQTWLAVGIGALLGLGALTRYSFGWLLIPVLAYLVFVCILRRWLVITLVLATFLGVFTPWVARNLAVSGTPFGTAGFALIEGTFATPEHKLARALEPDYRGLGLFPLLQKLSINTREILTEQLPQLGGSWVTALFLTGLLLTFRSLALRRLRYFLLASLGMLVLVQALGRTQLSQDSPVFNSENLLVLLIPVVFIYGAGLFFQLLDQMNFAVRELRYLVMGVFAILACLPMVFLFLTPKARPWQYPPYFPPTIQTAANYLKPDELMMSDIPWAVAWYGDRQCVWLTANAEDQYFAIHDFLKPIRSLYLTPQTTDSRFLSEWVRSAEKTWPKFILEFVLRRQAPENFPLKYARDGFFPEQLLLCDYPRWKDEPNTPTAPPKEAEPEPAPKKAEAPTKAE